LENSDRYALAAFGATRVDDGATAGSLHPHAKAVGLLSVGRRRLECAFHIWYALRSAHAGREKQEIIADSSIKRH
jgi:hypothetical protein